MLKKTFFMLVSWLVLLSVVSCVQVEPNGVAQNTLPAAQSVDGSPTTELADEEEVIPTPTGSKTEPAGNSDEAATPTATSKPPAIPDTPTPNKTEEEQVTVSPIDQGTEKLVKQASQDLAQRLNTTPDEIEVIEVQSVTWGDTSMGCPQPDMRYKQVPQDGLLIKLEAAGQVYEYHSGGSREPFLCQQNIRVKPTTPKLDEFVPSPDADK